jgi:formylmethanofuran dehydrogenase subunit C
VIWVNGTSVSGISATNGGYIYAPDITQLGTLSLHNTECEFPALTELSTVTFGSDRVPNSCSLPSLSSIGHLDITGPNATLHIGNYFTVDSDMIINDAGLHSTSSILTRVMHVGGNLTIRDSEDSYIIFSNLTGVGGTLVINNNTDCVLGFEEVVEMGAIEMYGNVDTIILGSMYRLQRAESIYLNGVVNV